MDIQKYIEESNEIYANLSVEELLKQVGETFGSKLVLASSLGVEDQLLTHYFVNSVKNPRVFVLDTGRFNQETYTVMHESKSRYGLQYEVYFPDRSSVEELVASKGPNSFYDSIENRKECCGIRKVEPLRRVLSTVDAWITGIRQAQSQNRQSHKLFEWDEPFSCIKINPLLKWSFEEVWEQVKALNVPYNVLHDRGYASIGCAPCTRSVKPGEDFRAGRWWWENESAKECGLHMVDGKLVRKKAEN